MGLKDRVGIVSLSESIEEAKGMTGCYRLVKLADEDSAVVGMDKVHDEFSNKLVMIVASKTFA